MKSRIPKRQPDALGTEVILVQCCAMLDRCIPGCRTGFLVAGIVAAALRTGSSADYLFVAGLLFHLALWFEHWWRARRCH
jgi:hypothetical protein